MKKIRTFLLWFVIVLTTLVGLFFMAGLLADPEYSGSKVMTVEATPEQVWNLLNDTERFSTSRHEVQQYEAMGVNEQGFQTWREHTRLWGAMTYEVTRQKPLEMLEIKMVTSDFGMSGNWIFELFPEGNKTRLVLTEHSENKGLLMRCILATVGRNANMGLLLNVVKKELKHHQ